MLQGCTLRRNHFVYWPCLRSQCIHSFYILLRKLKHLNAAGNNPKWMSQYNKSLISHSTTRWFDCDTKSQRVHSRLLICTLHGCMKLDRVEGCRLSSSSSRGSGSGDRAHLYVWGQTDPPGDYSLVHHSLLPSRDCFKLFLFLIHLHRHRVPRRGNHDHADPLIFEPYVPFPPPQPDDGRWKFDWDTSIPIVLQVRTHRNVTRWPEETSLEAKKH